MDASVDTITKTMKDILGFDVVRRLFFLAGIALSVLIGFNLYHWIQEPLYRPLDYQLTNQNTSAIIDTLEKANIHYKINDVTNTISVPADVIHLVNRTLSAAGIQKDDAMTFSFLNEKNKLGASQFFENARYSRALEADLAKTIRGIQGISAAKVTIAKPASNVFADEHAKTTASIMITIAPGYERDKEKIRAIIQLVAASVPDLDPANIAITDQYGHFLSSMISQDYLINQEQLSYEKNLEVNYEKRIQSLINPMLGHNNASINVNADIDFTQQEEANENYEPNQKNLRSEQTITENNGAAGGGGVPGALSNQPPDANSPDASGGAGKATHSEAVKNYELSKSTRYVKSNTPKIVRLSVAVVLDDDMHYDEATKKMVRQPQDQAKIDKVTALVKAAIGFNAKRGDIVTVVNAGFVHIDEEPMLATPLWQEPWFWDLIKKTVSIAVGFVLLVLVYRKISPELVGKRATSDLPPAVGGVNVITPEMLKLKNEQIQILKDMVSQDPNKVTGIIKKWIAK